MVTLHAINVTIKEIFKNIEVYTMHTIQIEAIQIQIKRGTVHSKRGTINSKQFKNFRLYEE